MGIGIIKDISGRIVTERTIRANEERVYNELEDSGVGMDGSITFKKTPRFGLMLSKILTEQLRGSIRMERNGGTKIGIAFPATGE